MTRGACRVVSTVRPLTLLLSLLLLMLPQCKPSDEPQRRAGATSAPGTSTGDTESAQDRGTMRLVAPERPANSSDNALAPGDSKPRPPEGDSTDDAAADASEPALSADTIARAKELGVDNVALSAILAPPTPGAEERASEANRVGIRKHRKLELKGAIQAYEAGLEAYPGHLFSRYNLACARALSGEAESALKELATISLVPGEHAQARLKAARVDPDFESLWANLDFRALTSFAPVEVSWSPSIADPQAVVTLVDLLRRAEIPAHEGREWRKDLEATTLYVAIDHTIAQGVASEVLESKAIDAKRVDSRFLNEKRPIVLVLGASGDGPKNTSLSLDDLIGKRLTATQEGAQEEFLLKPTGFFVWTQREANGTRIEKTGRYSLDGEALHLDFRVTTTSSGSPPDVQVEQGRRENHQLKLDGGALLLGDKRFEP